VYLIVISDTYTNGATPLDEGSARRRGLYLKTNYIYKRQTSVPLVGFELVIPASERLQTHVLDRASTRIQKQFTCNFWLKKRPSFIACLHSATYSEFRVVNWTADN